MIDWLFDALRPAFRATHNHAGRLLGVVAVLTVLGLWGTLQLRVDSDFSHLIPSSYPSVQALNELRDQIGGESEVAVLIESLSFEDNRAFAEALIPRALQLHDPDYAEPFFTRVTYRRDVEFLRHNALYFATPAELDSLTAYLQREIRQAKLEANPFYFELDLDEDSLDEGSDTTSDVPETLESLYAEFVTGEYPISADSTQMVVRFSPSGVQTNLTYIRDTYAALQDLVDTMGPEQYHPAMTVELGGRFQRQWIEVRAITRDVVGSFGSGVLMLLVMVMGYFFYKSARSHRKAGRSHRGALLRSALRAPVVALLLGIPLLVSLAWTFGVVYLAYGRLNVMTSTLGLILFGLGIDFGIHFLARYTEERMQGRSMAAAMDRTFQTTGRAIAAVAITTAGGFFVLLLADFRGFSQFGFTAGLGTFFALLAMLGVLPALLSLVERTRLLALTPHTGEADAPAMIEQRDASRPNVRPTLSRWLPRLSGTAAGLVLAVSLLGSGVAGTQLPDVRFEYDFGELEPHYEAYEAFKRKTRAVYSTHGSRNAAYVLTRTPGDAEAVADVLRARAEADTLSPTIDRVETLHDRFPMDPARQADKLAHLARIRDLLDDDLLRAASDDPMLDRLRAAARPTAPLPLDSVPSFVKDPFLTKQGTVGNVVIIYPSVGLADGRNSMAFADDVAAIPLPDGPVYHAGSTSIVASDMLRLMIEEAPWMVGLTLLLILLFKLLVLRTVRWVVVALIPLSLSFLWMFGIMGAFDLPLNFYNLVVLPTVLGIGDDSGIHIVHRYLEEGRGSVRRVLASTGEHVAMSSVTTMVGFGGLVMSMHPGLRSIGILAVLGIGLTLVAALVTLPALLRWMESRTDGPPAEPAPFIDPATTPAAARDASPPAYEDASDGSHR